MDIYSNILPTIGYIVAGLSSVGVFFGGVGYLISKYKGGSLEQKSESNDLISSNDQIKLFYKEQNEDRQRIIETQNEKIQALTREVGELRGQFNAETKQKEEYLAILQNRNPEMQKFMELLVTAVKDQQMVNKEIVKLLGEIHAMSTAEHERDFKVTATVSKTEHRA